MKRLISLALVFLMIFSFASCKQVGNKSEKTSKASSVEPKTVKSKKVLKITDSGSREEFRDSEGTVRYILDFTAPDIKGKVSDEAAQAIERFFDEYRNELVQSARLNVENYRDFMERFNVETPTTCLVTYTVYYQNENILSLIVSKKESSDPENAPAIDTGFTFDVNSGERLCVNDLFCNDEEESEDAVINAIIDVANTTYSENGVELEEEKIDDIINAYDPYNFVTEGKNITFLYTLDILSEGSRTGTYYCDVPYESIEDYVYNPAE